MLSSFLIAITISIFIIIVPSLTTQNSLVFIAFLANYRNSQKQTRILCFLYPATLSHAKVCVLL